VRTLWIIVGVAICAGALYLLYSGAVLLDANVRTGTFNLRFWEAYFWLKHPPALDAGLADNGLAWLELLGGAVAAIVGWGALRMVRHSG